MPITRKEGGVLVLLITVLVVASQMNYLFFHSVTELACLMAGLVIFTNVYLVEELRDQSFFRWMAVIFMSAGTLDLFHTLSYRGMGVFAKDPDLATAIWIAARFLQAASLLLVMGRKTRNVNDHRFEWIYGILTTLLLVIIFYTDWFPRTYIVGIGMTRFKILSEYLIILLLIGALLRVRLKSDLLTEKAAHLVRLFLVLTILSEMAFTLYLDLYSLTNVIGHLLKALAFYFIFRGIYVSGIRRFIIDCISQDALTGLVNRRQLEFKVQRRDRRIPHVFILADLDNLKRINDADGHEAGDTLIRRFAAMLNDACRDRDTIARIGGDEFGLLIADMTLAGAEAIIERIETAMARYNRNHPSPYPLSASFGITPVDRRDMTFKEMYQQADELMYAAKRIKKSNGTDGTI